MNAVILIPWRPGDPDRERAFEIVHRYYANLPYRIVASDGGPGPFSPAKARNTAAKAAKHWDVAMFVDADCALPLENIERALMHARDTGYVTLPWDEFYSITELGHRAQIDDRVPFGDPEREQRWQANSLGAARPLYSPGGAIAMPRVVWETVEGYDERFVGWSYEDAAILVKSGCFARLSGPQYHFWHTPSARGSPIPDFWYTEYASRPIQQWLVDEDRTITDFGGWG